MTDPSVQTEQQPRIAFKEWAVICRALASGQQDVILRKGGIVEPDGQFRLEANDFLLLPTFLHQTAESLTPEARPLLQTIEADRPPAGTVAFTHRAQITDAFVITKRADLKPLRSRHVWSDQVVEERFQRWQERLDVLVVTVRPLPHPLQLPWHDSYGGCKSWVHLVGDAGVSQA
jgi:hypothetical protein